MRQSSTSPPAGQSSQRSQVTSPAWKVTLRVPRMETAATTGRLLSEQSVEDLAVEDPPIEDVIELAFASGVEG